MHQLMDGSLRLMAEAVQRYDGRVNHYLGDGLMALFGAPVTLEDHAVRGVQAALTIQETLRGYSEELRKRCGVEIQLRIGISTGPVVVGRIGDDLRMDYTAVGKTTNLAARMQSAAEPGHIVITEDTHRLVQGYVHSDALRVKGVSEPLVAYRVTGRRPGRTRFQISSERGLTPLVGRERELALLHDCLARVKSGRGQVVGVVGEPGVGKSRLLHEFRGSLEGEPIHFLEGQCVAYGQSTPYFPILQIIRSTFEIEEEDNPLQIREKLRQGTLQLDPALEPILPFLSDLLGLSTGDAALVHLEPRLKRRKTFEALRALAFAGSQLRPLVLLLEDLHWMDRTSEDYLSFLIESLAGAPILLLTTQRIGYDLRWGDKSYCSRVNLDLLTEQEGKEMVAKLLGTDAFPSDLPRIVRSKAEGIPLFVEEIIVSLFERGNLVRDNAAVRWKGDAAVEVPASVQDIVGARIDRLDDPVKRLLQVAAVIGREFGLQLLRRISETPDEVDACLDSLKRLELIYETRFFPAPAFTFKHAVIQDVAYASLLSKRRRELHGAIAGALEQLHTDRQDGQAALLAMPFSESEPPSSIVDTQPELPAYHYTEAGLSEQAIPYWQRAGKKAVERSANVEAIRHLTKGLELLATLPDTAERTRQEIQFQIALGAPLIAAKGYAAPEVEHSFARARSLCQQVGESPELFRVFWGLGASYLIGAKLPAARVHAQQCLTLAERERDPNLLLEAHSWLGTVLFYLNDMAAARSHLEEALALYEPEQHRSHAFQYGLDPAVLSAVHRHWLLWLRGYPDQAMNQDRETRALAEDVAHPLSMAHALNFSAVHHSFRGEALATKEITEAEIDLSNTHQFPHYLAYATILQGWAIADMGQIKEGIDCIHEGLGARRATGAELARPFFLTLLAEAYGKDGQPEEGLKALEQGLALVVKTEERWWEPELHRLEGELLLLQARRDPAEAEAFARRAESSFQQAIDDAGRHGARSLELRAVTSLCRLWQHESRWKKARKGHEMLTQIYGWFTEGFDTADLKGAKSLLDEMS